MREPCEYTDNLNRTCLGHCLQFLFVGGNVDVIIEKADGKLTIARMRQVRILTRVLEGLPKPKPEPEPSRRRLRRSARF